MTATMTMNLLRTVPILIVVLKVDPRKVRKTKKKRARIMILLMKTKKVTMRTRMRMVIFSTFS
jgi:hypothetical protein